MNYLEGEELYEQVDDIFAEERKRDRAKVIEEDKQLMLDIKNIISSESGRRFIWWIVSQGGIFVDAYNGKALDMARASGIKALAVMVLNKTLKADPKFLVKLFNELLEKGD